jgi:hypothetical protein
VLFLGLVRKVETGYIHAALHYLTHDLFIICCRAKCTNDFCFSHFIQLLNSITANCHVGITVKPDMLIYALKSPLTKSLLPNSLQAIRLWHEELRRKKHIFVIQTAVNRSSCNKKISDKYHITMVLANIQPIKKN